MDRVDNLTDMVIVCPGAGKKSLAARTPTTCEHRNLKEKEEKHDCLVMLYFFDGFRYGQDHEVHPGGLMAFFIYFHMALCVAGATK